MIVRLAKRAIIICIIGFIAGITGIFVSLWLANYTSQPNLFLAGGALLFIFVYVAGILLTAKYVKDNNQKRYKIIAYTFGGILLSSLVFILLFPLSDEQNKPREVKGQKYWNLPSGSKIAYVYLSGKGNSNLPPVLFLHGGPGVPDMAGDSSYFGKLTQAGYDVYIYDEVGSGLSSRLEDPSAYTIQKDVIDLEAIRKKIETDRMILIGHSYGSEVVANYMASYDGTVEKAVFISPGGINPEDTSGGNLISRLSISEKWHLFRSMLHPRVMMAYSLLQVNPLAAINYVGDDEMDARFDIVYKKSQAALHAIDKPVGPQLSGLGFYAHQTPQSAAAEPKIDIRGSLSKKDTPALIIKGASDYLSWSSAIDYKKALHNSRLIYFKHAGHNVYQDQPDLFMKVIKAFLAERTLPVEAYSDTAPPKDYEGVPSVYK